MEGLAPSERLPSGESARATTGPDGLTALTSRKPPAFDDHVPAELDSDEEEGTLAEEQLEVCQICLN